MKKYNVTITETLKKRVEVSAESLDEAEQKVNDSWYRGDYILDADDFDGVEFDAADVKINDTIKAISFKPHERDESR